MIGASFGVRSTIVQQESRWTTALRASDDLAKTKGHNNILKVMLYVSENFLSDW